MAKILVVLAILMYFAKTKTLRIIFTTLFVLIISVLGFQVYIGAQPSTILVLPGIAIAFSLFASEVKNFSDGF